MRMVAGLTTGLKVSSKSTPGCWEKPRTTQRALWRASEPSELCLWRKIHLPATLCMTFWQYNGCDLWYLSIYAPCCTDHGIMDKSIICGIRELFRAPLHWSHACVLWISQCVSVGEHSQVWGIYHGCYSLVNCDAWTRWRFHGHNAAPSHGKKLNLYEIGRASCRERVLRLV